MGKRTAAQPVYYRNPALSQLVGPLGSTEAQFVFAFLLYPLQVDRTELLADLRVEADPDLGSTVERNAAPFIGAVVSRKFTVQAVLELAGLLRVKIPCKLNAVAFYIPSRNICELQ